MKINISAFSAWSITFIFLLILSSCHKDKEDDFPITNDLRVLKVTIGNKSVISGVTDQSVIAEVEFVFSHALNTGTFENAFSISPEADMNFSYDDSKSIVTLHFATPLDYESTYIFSLAKGSYGANGESSIADYEFEFTTAAFEPPSVVLSSSETSFYEGQTIHITATLSRAIVIDVEMDLQFSGVAQGEGIDYSISTNHLIIPAGESTASIQISALGDMDLEGEESLIVTIANLENAIEEAPQQLLLSLGDLPPAIELKGVMSLKMGGSTTNGRAIHLRVLEDIPDLSNYGIGIANNGGGSDGREIDFPSQSVSEGDDIILVRDIDKTMLSEYFEEKWNLFVHVFESDGLNFNGDDPFELYNGDIVIESYGDVELDGTGLEWEWTGTWAYKLNDVWEYGEIDCSENSNTMLESACPYPFCFPLQLHGVMALLWDGSGTNGGKATHYRANRRIEDLSRYSIGIANNGGGTDGIEFTFPAMAVEEGAHILLAREPETIGNYFGACYAGYDHVFQSDAMNQNGDDAAEFFEGEVVIQNYGDPNTDGTDQPWEYKGSWAYKMGSTWVTGGVDCAAGSFSTQGSACPYPFCQ